MRFRCLKHGETLPRSARDQFYLVPDRWDDWFQFETRFMLYSYDSNCVKRCIGMVKIAKAGMRGESFAKFEELKSSGVDVANIR